MKRATKWLAFVVIMAMLAAALLALPASAMAEEVQPPGELTGGIIEALVWDDLRTPDGVIDYNDLIDGMKVRLWHLQDKKYVPEPDPDIQYPLRVSYVDIFGQTKEAVYDGKWVQYGETKVTGPGGFWWGQEATIEYEHGWVGWNNLPLDNYWDTTYYKVELVDDGTYDALNMGERIAQLNPSNWHSRQYFAVGDKDLPPFEIKSTTAAISGYVWSDANANLIRQFPEQHLADWTVVLTNRYGSKIASTKTNRYGYYYFRGLQPGTYKVWVVDQRSWNQVAPYYKFCTWPPWGCDKGHYTINGVAGKYYNGKDFGMLDMRDSVWAPLYYALWWVGLLQYQFTW